MTGISLGSVDEIPVGAGRAFTVDDHQIAVFRLRDGALRALDAVCPHRGGPLADGIADDQVVICPLRNYTYDLSTGEETANGGAGVRAYSVHVDDSELIRLTVDGKYTAESLARFVRGHVPWTLLRPRSRVRVERMADRTGSTRRCRSPPETAPPARPTTRGPAATGSRSKGPTVCRRRGHRFSSVAADI